MRRAHDFLSGRLEYVHPIGTEGELTGLLFLQSDLHLLSIQLVRYGLIIAGVLAGLLAELEHIARMLRAGFTHPDAGQRVAARTFGAVLAVAELLQQLKKRPNSP